MPTFHDAMTEGQAVYQDVLDALAAAGYPGSFTQTGGMNAALEVLLEEGWALLITDAADALSWSPSEQQGWGVGLFLPEERYWAEPRAFAACDDTGIPALLQLMQFVLRAGVSTR